MELNKLSDSQVLSSLSQLVKTEKATTLKVLEYLSQVDTRRLWLKEGFSSLFDFCVRYLKYTEGETTRRIQGARTLSRFHEVKPLLEQEELSLTHLCLLSPHLNESNIAPLLEEARNKSTRQVEQIIERQFPESKKKPKILIIPLDNELEELLEQVKTKLSERLPAIYLKRVLKDYLKPKKTRTSHVKTHTRYIPKAIQRQVKLNYSNQCGYLSPSGHRCNQRYHLELDHVRPFAKGGSSLDPTNIRLLCSAHNLMFADQDFPRQKQNRHKIQTQNKSPSTARA